MGTLDRTLPPEYQQTKTDGDRLVEEEEFAPARVKLETALGMLEDFYAAERALLSSRIFAARKGLFEARMEAAVAAVEAEDEAGARAEFEAAIELAPDAASRDRARARLNRVGQEDEVQQSVATRLERLEHAVEEDPDSPELTYNLAIELALDGFLQAAAEQLRRVVSLTADDPETCALAWFRLGNVCSDLYQHTEDDADFDHAREAYDEARKLGYEPAEVEYRVAQLHELKGDHPAATAALRACLEADPEHLSALSALAHCLEMEGQAEESLEVLGRLLALDDEDGEAHFRVGCLKLAGEDRDGAIAAFEASLRVAPDGEFSGDARSRLDELQPPQD